MKHIFQHQLDQFLTYLSWGLEWADDDQPGCVNPTYLHGAAETLGHQLSCWLVQVCGMVDCETAVCRDLLFKKAGKPHTLKKIEHDIKKWLRDCGVEVIDG
jgi:hypothetical protein